MTSLILDLILKIFRALHGRHSWDELIAACFFILIVWTCSVLFTLHSVILHSNNIKVIKQLWFQECGLQSYHMINLLHVLIASEAASDWNLYSLLWRSLPDCHCRPTFKQHVCDLYFYTFLITIKELHLSCRLGMSLN